MATTTTPHDLVQQLLARIETGRVGLLFDYDGTLADIAPRPELARLEAESLSRLVALTQLPNVEVAIISGRSLSGLRGVAGPLPGLTLAVNGGLRLLSVRSDWIHPDVEALLPDLKQVADVLTHFVQARPGMILEDKDLSLAVHYRLHPEGRPQLEALLTTLIGNSGGRLRAIPGKESLEIQPNVPWDKGRAAATLLDRWGVGSAALFVGDDRIDEPAFVEVRQRGGVTCRIAEESAPTEAEWLLATPARGRELLDLLPAAIRAA